jgi:hypothetical protein
MGMAARDERITAAESGFLNGLLRFDRSMGSALEGLDDDIAGHPAIVICQAYQYLLGGMRPPAAVCEAMQRIETVAASKLESAHLAAAKHLLRGAYGDASKTLLDISREFPYDALALAAGHQVDFLSGTPHIQLARLTASPLLREGSSAAYPYLLAMLAFAYGENGEYTKSHDAGTRAISIAPDDNPWAVHACAHALFETREHRAVSELLATTRTGWMSDNCLLRIHLTWHDALNSMAAADRDALAERTAELTGVLGPGCSAMQFCDVVSLLWRLQLAGLAEPSQFDIAADIALDMRKVSNSAFVDMHILLAIVGAGRYQRAAEVAGEMCADLADIAAHLSGTRRTAVGVADSFQHYCRSNPEQAVRRLISILPGVIDMGGSVVQRDLALELLVTCGGGRAVPSAIVPGIDVTARPLVTNLVV